MELRTKSTFGEALITLGALAGFVFLFSQGKMLTQNSMILYIEALGVLIVFYFLLLLARAIFTFMTGGDSFWWEKYEEHNPHAKKK